MSGRRTESRQLGTRRSRAQAERVRVVVRGGRRTLRIDGSFASTWQPGRETTGCVWDALAAGLLALPAARRRDVLLLGLGGGSAARAARALAPRARIVAVELDPAVVRAARRWFDVGALGLEVVTAEAAGWLRRARGRFDAVLEDVFTGGARRLVKPPGFPLPALDDVRRLLRPGGVAVCNTLDESAAVSKALAARFRGLVEIGVVDYDNRIYVASDRPVSGAALRAAAAASPLAPSLSELRFRRLPRGSAAPRR